MAKIERADQGPLLRRGRVGHSGARGIRMGGRRGRCLRLRATSCRSLRWRRRSRSAGSSTRRRAKRCRSRRCSAPWRRPSGSAGFARRSPSAIVGYLACDYLFVAPRNVINLLWRSTENVVGLFAYAVTSAVIILLGEAMRNARARADDGQERLRVTLRSIGDARDRHRCRGSRHLHERGGRVVHGMDAAEAWPAARRSLPHRQRRHPPAGREPGRPGAPRRGDRRPRQPHSAHSPGRHRMSDRRQRRADPTSADTSRLRAGLPRRHRAARRRDDEAGQLATARLLAAIVESSDDAIISKSLDGIIQSWNAAAERLFGYSAGAGRRPAHLARDSARADRAKKIRSSRHLRPASGSITSRRTAFATDGRRITVSLTISPIATTRATSIGASKIVRDITERKPDRGRTRAVRDAHRKQHRLHRHLRPEGRAVLRESCRARDGGARQHRAARRKNRRRFLLPGGPGADRTSFSRRCWATDMARSRCVSVTSRPAPRAGWCTRC